MPTFLNHNYQDQRGEKNHNIIVKKFKKSLSSIKMTYF